MDMELLSRLLEAEKNFKEADELSIKSTGHQDYSITACFVANLNPGGWKWKGKEKQEIRLKKELEEKKNKSMDPKEIQICIRTTEPFHVKTKELQEVSVLKI